MIAGQTQIDVRRPNFRDLSEPTGRPVRFYSVNEEQLSLNGFWRLVLDRRRVPVAKFGERELALALDRLALAPVSPRRAHVVLMRGLWSVASGGFPCRHSRSAHNKRRSMNSGTNTRRLFEMHSSDVFSLALECMPDKIAGQAQVLAAICSAIFIGKSGV